jgi:hypothetical protein
MAVAAQEQITPEAPRPSKPARRRAATWPKPSQLKQSVPILRLLAEIWSTDNVLKVGVMADEEGVHLRVLLADEDRAARSSVYAAEREYLNATPPHGFELHVSAASKAGHALPFPFEAILER